jgi:hypothetical protein
MNESVVCSQRLRVLLCPAVGAILASMLTVEPCAANTERPSSGVYDVRDYATIDGQLNHVAEIPLPVFGLCTRQRIVHLVELFVVPPSGGPGAAYGCEPDFPPEGGTTNYLPPGSVTFSGRSPERRERS